VKQQEADAAAAAAAAPGGATSPAGTVNVAPTGPSTVGTTTVVASKPKRYHGTVALDPTRVGRDASRVADEVISHLGGLVGAKVKVTLEIEAQMPDGASEQVVRTVTENGRTLKFTSQGFEKD
jgi:hypothetical protein